MTAAAPPVLLEVRNLSVLFPTPDGVVKAVSDVSFTLRSRETLAIVGESGSGKSVMNLAIMGLLNARTTEISGEIHFNGANLLTLDRDRLRRLRGRDISMIFQDPFASLHPMYTVGDQLVEAVVAHTNSSRRDAFERVVASLEDVGIPNARVRARDYPHQFSGGMRQRVMIAMALLHRPAMVIADEPTTALDVTVQAQILRLLNRVKREFHMATILVTHNLGIVADIADTVLVMYAGQVMEHGPATDIFRSPQHPYTWALLESIPTIERKLASLRPIEGAPPSLLNPPSGCPFHPRCRHRFGPCSEERPPLRALRDGHTDACHLGVATKRQMAEAHESLWRSEE